MKFCGICGASLERREFEHRTRLFCPECGQIHYDQLKVGAGGLIEWNGKLLLLQRTTAPFEHCWNLPAGYVESDESPTQAVIREINEETGLMVEVEELIDVYFFPDDPRGNGILIVYKCRSIGGELTASAEGDNPTYFGIRDIPGELAGGGHDQAILTWKRARVLSRTLHLVVVIKMFNEYAQRIYNLYILHAGRCLCHLTDLLKARLQAEG